MPLHHQPGIFFHFSPQMFKNKCPLKNDDREDVSRKLFNCSTILEARFPRSHWLDKWCWWRIEFWILEIFKYFIWDGKIRSFLQMFLLLFKNLCSGEIFRLFWLTKIKFFMLTEYFRSGEQHNKVQILINRMENSRTFIHQHTYQFLLHYSNYFNAKFMNTKILFFFRKGTES